MAKDSSESTITGPYTQLPSRSGRIFVVGDIHGCRVETEILLKHLSHKELLDESDTVVFLGDYIDRGADSKGVIQALLDFKNLFPSAYFLRGNHEEMLFSFIKQEGEAAELYLVNGGKETLKSYGVSSNKPTGTSAAELLENLPNQHWDFLRSLHRYIVSDQYVFVHAGLDPLRSLHTQVDEDIYWIRDEFIFNIHFFERTIIFGHTPFENVLFHLPYKIGIDTGAVFGNKLTCIELKEQRVLQVESQGKDGSGSSKVLESKFVLNS